MLRNFITFDWFTVFTLAALISITIAKQLFRTRFKDFVIVFSNSKYLKIYEKDQKFIDTFDGLLFFNLVISASIFLFICFKTLVHDISFDLILFLKIITGVAVFFLIKILIERLVGSIFEIDALMDTYLFQKTTYKNFSGLVLLIANLFLVYGNLNPQAIIFVCIGLLVVINGIGFATSLKNNLRSINLNIFYFLLYLCALEIGPYIILYKVVREYNG